MPVPGQAEILWSMATLFPGVETVSTAANVDKVSTTSQEKNVQILSPMKGFHHDKDH